MAIYIGIDGGGSKTACAVGDDVAVLALATTGGCNPTRVGTARAQRELQSAVRQALEIAGVEPRAVVRTCVAMAGISCPTTRDLVTRALGECASGEIELVGDMEAAMYAAFGTGAGMITVAGTGSIAFGRNHQGRTARAGGWGHAISDEGSGHWIGRESVRRALRASDDSGSVSPLDLVLRDWQISSQAELVEKANLVPAPDFANLLPSVIRAAEAGDNICTAVLHDAGAELARLSRIVAERLWGADDVVRVALCGGVFRHSRQVRQAFYTELRRVRAAVAVSFAVVDPVVGALDLARGARAR